MMNLIQNFFSPSTKDNKAQIRNNFITYFYSISEHAWILESCNKSHFDSLFAHLPTGVLEAMMTKYPIVFTRSEDMRMKDRVGVILNNTIVVFPEFQKLLASNKKSAIAYLAHEIAFVLLELEGVTSEPIMAEVEADKFVCDLGLTFELEEFLLMLDESVEKRLRLTYVTLNHFKENN